MPEKIFSVSFKTTADMPVSDKLVDQVIGQERAVDIIRKAAAQRRNVLLIGSPGTGKSMLAQAMAQLLPVEVLQDVLIFPNSADPNNPKVRVVEAGKGSKILEEEKKKSTQGALADMKPPTSALFGVMLMFSLSIAISIYLKLFSDIIIAAFIIVGGIFLSILLFASAFASGLKSFRFGNREADMTPKLLIDNSGKTAAPFVDATGAHAGALLGDIKHDPYQCLPPGAKILMPDGSAKSIGELVDGKMPDPGIDPRASFDLKKQPFSVLGYDDDNRKFVNTDVTRVYRREYEGELVEFETAGGRKLSSTPEHPIGVPYGSRTSYVQARLLKKGHFVLIREKDGTLASDKVTSVRKSAYKGCVYNLTTKTQNFVMDNSLVVHNSGGLGTPPHLRVEAGLIHKANGGVLYVDEIATLSPKSQQELLTAMQEKKYSITGQSEMSSGAMVRTDPVPCGFLLVASGNVFDMDKMHPALRSRIRGYGYEVFLNDSLPDTPENRDKIPQFVAQEVTKDGKIPHFSQDAVEELVLEARRRSGRRGKLTLRLRDLGGLVRAAGDLARSNGAKVALREHVVKAKRLSRTLEQQIADKQVELKKEYEVYRTSGATAGRVNGLAVLGSVEDGGTGGGILLPIEAQVTPALAQQEGKIIATGKLGEIAKEAVQNVSAIVKKYKGAGISGSDVHIQFLQTYEGVEGDSASVSVATAVVSAMENIPVSQEVAMTGSLSVKGEVLPVGGITPKIEAAVEAGIKTVIVPQANSGDVFLEKTKIGKVRIIPARDLCDVLRVALRPGKDKDRLISSIAKIIRK